MKFTTFVLGTVLVLSFSNTVFAKADIDTKDCTAQTVTSAYITLLETVNLGTDLGKYYEDYMNKVKALPQTGKFNHFKLISQNLTVNPSYNTNSSINPLQGPITARKVYIAVAIEFDLNYQAVTDINTVLKATDYDVTTKEVKRCQ